MFMIIALLDYLTFLAAFLTYSINLLNKKQKLKKNKTSKKYMGYSYLFFAHLRQDGTRMTKCPVRALGSARGTQFLLIQNSLAQLLWPFAFCLNLSPRSDFQLIPSWPGAPAIYPNFPWQNYFPLSQFALSLKVQLHMHPTSIARALTKFPMRGPLFLLKFPVVLSLSLFCYSNYTVFSEERWVLLNG